MIRVITKKTAFMRSVSLFLVLAFSSYNNAAFAVAEKKDNAVNSAAVSALAPTHTIEDVSSMLSVGDINIAIDAGTIKSKYTGHTGRMIVHIQDAHCNFEAQSNINSILGQLTRENEIDMISVEGAEGIVDTAWFRAFPDAEIRKEVATYFMKKGEITGAEFFSINSDYEGYIFGAETRDYYVKNLKAFTEVYPHKESIEKYLKETRAIATRLKSIVYSPALKKVDSKIRSFKDKETELSDYAEYLQKTAAANHIDIKDCVDFGKLLQTLEYERKIDFDIVDQERSAYIDLLSKKLSKEAMVELVSESVKFKKGHIEAVDFYTYLRDLAKEYDIAIVQEYPNLFYYYIYTKLYDGINNENLFREMNRIEARLKKKLFQNDTQEKLDKYASMIDMYNALVNIELTNEDYDLFKAYSDEFSMDDVLSFMSGLCGRYNLNCSVGELPFEIKEKLPGMVDFYEIAMKRDTALIDNTLEKMKEDGKDRCVLIAGGFHTRGIKNLLEKKGISYVVVTPKITKDVETPYIKVLTNQRTSLEDIITESAAMPGADTSDSEEGSDRAEREMLSPFLRAMYASKLFDDAGQQELNDLVVKLGDEQGPEFIKRINELRDGALKRYTEEWLKKIKAQLEEDNGAPVAAEIISFFLTNGEMYQKLVGYFLNELSNGVEKACRENTEKADRIFTELKASSVEQLKTLIPQEFGGPLTWDTSGSGPSGGRSAGEKAHDADLASFENARRIDGVYRSFIQSGKADVDSDKFVHNDIASGFRFVTYDGLLYGLLKRELSTSIRPGRGGDEKFHKELEAHLDIDVYNRLREEGIRLRKDENYFLNIIGRHELAHLDIFNADEIAEEMAGQDKSAVSEVIERKLGKRALDTWTKWNDHIAAIEKRYGHPLTQKEKDRYEEYFVNKVLGHDVAGETARINNGVVALKVHGLVLETLVSDAPDGQLLQKMLEKAYVMASEQGYTDLLVQMLDSFQQAAKDNPVKEETLKKAFVGMAKRYPILVRRSLIKYVNKQTASLLHKWFQGSELAAEIKKEDIKGVILTGGIGKRLFLLSNDAKPKQFADILDEPLLIMAVNRLKSNLGANNIYIQTTAHLKDQVARILRTTGIPEENIFVEPQQADTAPAIGYTAVMLERLGFGDKVTFVGTADHFIDMSTPRFQDTYMKAAKIAKNSRSMGTIGIDPEPIGVTTIYGCIKKGEKTFFMDEKAVEVAEFSEKPEKPIAEQYFGQSYGDGTHLWLYNAGMWLFQPNVVLEAFKKYAPFYGDRLERMRKAKTEGERKRIAARIFAEFAECKNRIDKKTGKKAPGFPHHAEPTGMRSGVSIDYVLAQVFPDIFVIPGEFNWMDIGSYLIVYKYGDEIAGLKDDDGNVVYSSDTENIKIKNCTNCLIHAKDPNVKLTVEGLNNALVVYNPDIKGVMVAPLETGIGKAIEDILIPRLTGDKALVGYYKGEVKFPDKKIMMPVRDDEKDNFMVTIDRGDALIAGTSRESFIGSGLGLGVILNMNNVALSVLPQEDNKDFPEIKVIQGADDSDINKIQYYMVGKFEVPNTNELLKNPDMRIDNFVRMLERGDIDKIDAKGYLDAYGNAGVESLNQAEREVIEVYKRVHSHKLEGILEKKAEGAYFASPALVVLGSKSDFSEEQVRSIMEKAGEAAKDRATKSQRMSLGTLAEKPSMCRDIIAQGVRDNFIRFIVEGMNFQEMKDIQVRIGQDKYLVYHADEPLEINLGGTFHKMKCREFYISPVHDKLGMRVYFAAEDETGREEWGSFTIENSEERYTIISSVEGSTPEVRDTLGTFMLSFFVEKYQGIDLARDNYVSREILPQLAYYRLKESVKKEIDSLVESASAEVARAIMGKSLAKDLTVTKLEQLVSFASSEEAREEVEELKHGADLLQEERKVTTVDFREIISAFLGNIFETRSELAELKGVLATTEIPDITGFGTEELYKNITPLIARYVNVRVRDKLIKMLDTLENQPEFAPEAKTETAERTVGIFGASSESGAGAGYAASTAEGIQRGIGGLSEGEPVKLVPNISTGSKGDTWGEKWHKVVEEKVDEICYIFRLLGARTVDAAKELAKKFNIPLQRRTPSDEKVDQEIAKLDIDSMAEGNVPKEDLLGLVPDEGVLGGDYIAEHGAQDGMTTNVVTSERWGTIGVNEFDKYIYALEDGKMILGIDGRRITTAREDTPEGFIISLESGYTTLFNEVTIKKGEVFKIPAGMPYAYGKARIIEVNDVPAYAHGKKTKDLYDRLGLEEKKLIEVGDIVSRTQDRERIAREVIKAGLAREGKDILTMPEEESLKIAEFIEEKGFLKGIRLEDYKLQPEVLKPEDGIKHEQLVKDSKIVWSRYEITEGAELESVSWNQSVFIESGKVQVTFINRKQETLEPVVFEQGRSFYVPRTATGWKLKALEGPAVIQTRYKPVTKWWHEGAERVIEKIGESIEGVDKIAGKKVPKYITTGFVKGGSLRTRIKINETAPVPTVTADGRRYTIYVREGKINITAGGRELTYEGKPAVFGAGTAILVKPDMGEMIDSLGRIFPYEGKVELPKDKSAPDKSAKVEIADAKGDEEKIVYAAFDMVRAHKETVKTELYGVIAPDDVFRSGTKNDPGSADFAADRINEFLGKGKDKKGALVDVLDVRTYHHDELGLNMGSVGSLIENFVKDGRIPVLAATKALLKKAAEDMAFQKFLKDNDVRIMPALPDELDTLEDGAGWFFSTELLCDAIVQGRLGVEDVRSKSSFAQDVRLLMLQHTGRLVDIEELYYLVGLGSLDKIPDNDFKPATIGMWMNYLANYLFLNMPIRPFTEDALRALENRRKIMWSV